MSIPERIPRSVLLDAHHAKFLDAQNRLSADCIAFVQTISRDTVSGYVFYASRGAYRIIDDDAYLYTAFLVGNPEAQVFETEGAIYSFNDETAIELDARDAYASVVCAMLAEDNGEALKARLSPQANAVETLFLDNLGFIRWCSFDGTSNEVSIEPRMKRLIVRGCHNDAIKKQVTKLLREFQALSRQSKKSVSRVVRELKKITNARVVGYHEVSKSSRI